MADDLNGHRVVAAFGEVEHHADRGNGDGGQDEGWDHGPGDLELGVAVHLLGFLAARAVSEGDDAEQDPTLNQHEDRHRNPEDRPEEVVDLLCKRASRLDCTERSIFDLDQRARGQQQGKRRGTNCSAPAS